MCYTSARDLALKAIFNNNLYTQTNGVMVNPENPENPDSNLAAARIISTQEHNPTILVKSPTLLYRGFLLRYQSHKNK
jgi:hypothetical protein